MSEPGSDRRRTVKSADEARQGVTGHNVRFVLTASMLGTVVVFALIWFYFAH